MIKTIKFLRENVSKDVFVQEICSMLNNDVYKQKNDGFGQLNKYAAEFSGVMDSVVSNIYDSKLNVIDCTEVIVDTCYNFQCETTLNILYLVSFMLDKVRVKKGIDFRKVWYVKDLCACMEAQGFIVNPIEYDRGKDTFSFSKDNSISMSYIIDITYDRMNQSFVDFRHLFVEEYRKYQRELAKTPLSIWR